MLNHRPKYTTGHAINIGMLCFSIILSITLIFYCRWENRQRTEGKRDHRLQGGSGREGEREEMLGYRHPKFLYTI
jgi:hypothetical protein